MNILGIGETVIDAESIHHISGGIVGKQIGGGTRDVGGPVAAAMVVLARLGQDCRYVTSVGRDGHGQVIREALHREGVGLIEHTQSLTKVNQILVDADSGQRLKIRGAVKHPAIRSIETALILQADLIIIDRHEPLLFGQVMRTKRAATQVVIDPSTEISEHTLDMIARAEHPIVPIEAVARLAAGDTIISGLHELYAGASHGLVVTAGELGSLFYDGHRLELVPGLDLRAVDTLGAGDVFRGAFAYGLSQGWNALTSAKFANGVAGLQCLRLGNLAAIPSRADMLALGTSTRPLRQVTLHHINDRFRELRRGYIVAEPTATPAVTTTKANLGSLS